MSPLSRLLTGAAVAAAAATLATALASHYWFFELFTHFRLQMVAGASLLALTAAVCRLPVATAVLAGVAGWHALVMWDYLLPGSAIAAESGDALRVLSVNVGRGNSEYPALQSLIDEELPDVVVLMEVDRAWLDSLQQLDGRYPHRIARPEDGFYGLAILSRYPLRESPGSPLIHDGVQTALLADLEIAGRTVFMAATHLRAPTASNLAEARNEQIRMLAEIFREKRDVPRMLVGDLNVTPWSPWYELLESGTGIANVGVGQGYMRTWPTHVDLLGIPIDHCLVSSEFQVIDAATLRDVGSDHAPLLVKMTLSTQGVR